uniref:Oligomycin resistance ATP-dependent permease YOR1 n=1 Tax=Talaromyces marneffei PM1 TaxID=1077442 RepID=A0A093XXB2_TALMA
MDTKKENIWRGRFNPLRWGKPPPIPGEREVTKENKTGYRRPLEYNDIWLLHPDRTVEPLAIKLQTSFQERVSQNQKNPLLWAIYDTFRYDILLSAINRMLADLFVVFAPFTLRYLLIFVQDSYDARMDVSSSPFIGKGIGLVVGIIVMQVLQSLTNCHFQYRSMLVGGQTRSVLISAIFTKSMKLSNRAKIQGTTVTLKKPSINGKKKQAETFQQDAWTDGRIVNLMSNDTQRIFQASKVFHYVWSSPISIILAIILLVINLTYSALPGIAILVIGLVGVTYVVRTLSRRRDIINGITDQRISLTQEILQSIRFVKYFAWEKSFQSRLTDIRAKEIHSIQILLTIRSALGAVAMAIPIFANMLAYITYSLTDHNLNAAVVFSSLALFNCLRTPLNWLPVAIGQAVDAWTSIQRIEAFLLAEEIQEQADLDREAPAAIQLNDASFTWEKPIETKTVDDDDDDDEDTNKHGEKSESPHDERQPFQLKSITMTAGRGELVAIVGAVGSGKTSLLSAIVGEMRKTSGQIILGGSKAYCPQHAWIQNTTIRDNIIFGKPFDPEWYQRVVEACALVADFKILPAGDMTEIGERGINLSGGQKQRINLARAIYFQSDIILMDDPLSAVDAHVGRHILENAICGLLKGKSRILATHQLHVLSRCDRVIWLENGQVITEGPYTELLERHEGFRTLVSQVSGGDQDNSQDENENHEDQPENESSGTATNDSSLKLVTAETKAVKSVPWSVYVTYARASGSVFNIIGIFVLLVTFRGANIMTSLWLSYWSEDQFSLSRNQYTQIGIYAALAVLQGLLLFSFSAATSIFGTRASKKLLEIATWKVLRTPVSFFDTTPLGRITRRFTKDIDWMDNNLTDALRILFLLCKTSSSSCGQHKTMVNHNSSQFAIAIIPLACALLIWTAYYRASARELKRYESLLDSSMYARFTEALTGVPCVRAYELQGQFTTRLISAIEDMGSAQFLTFGNERWLSVRLDAIGNTLVLVTGILVLIDRYNISPSISGLILSYSLSLVQLIQLTVRQFSDVEAAMNGSERIIEYTSLPSEAQLDLNKTPPKWPENGQIQFENVGMRYRPGLPLALSNFNLNITGGERIGIVGRTGAGKSSILSTLFRMVELSSGKISIDGVDISTIGLHELRSKLAIIPQDPTLFKGTVRSNLDPFGDHSDLVLWNALRQSCLIPLDPSSSDSDLDKADTSLPRSLNRVTLDSPVADEGQNFSLGQRQLLALSRALVRDSKIIVIDEGTSSVDQDTDKQVQRTIQHGFKGKTILSVAHRLHTVLNYDRICVMEKGEIVELGTPKALWQAGGIFSRMCQRSGIGNKDFEAKLYS